MTGSPQQGALWFRPLGQAQVAGTVLEVNGELHATVLGLGLMFTSELCEATGLVLTQRLLQDPGGCSWGRSTWGRARYFGH